MVAILKISAKLDTLDLFKIMVFWYKVYDVIMSVDDITNKILLGGSNNTVDMLMWPKFGNSSISMTEVIITSIS